MLVREVRKAAKARRPGEVRDLWRHKEVKEEKREIFQLKMI